MAIVFNDILVLIKSATNTWS